MPGIPDLFENLPHSRDLGVQSPDAAFLSFVRNISHHPAEGAGVQGMFYCHTWLGTFAEMSLTCAKKAPIQVNAIRIPSRDRGSVTEPSDRLLYALVNV